MNCAHKNMKDSARRDWCPDCGYEFYYGDAYATNPEDQISKLVNPGRDAKAGKSPEELADDYWLGENDYYDIPHD